MADKNNRQDEGSENQGQRGRRGRKPSVPPIIDLEATEVEGGPDTGASGTATRLDPEEPASAGAAGAARGSRRRSGFRSILNPFLWGTAMKRLLSLRISHLRWSRIGAVIAAALVLFAGGVWLGRDLVPPAVAPLPVAETTPDPQLGAIESSVLGLGERLDRLDGAMAGLADQMRQTEAAAAQALQGLAAVQTTRGTRAHVPGAGGEQESLGRLQLQMGALATRFEALEAAVTALGHAAPPEALEQRLDALAAALAELKGAVGATPDAGAGDAIAALAEEFRTGFADLEARLDTFEATDPRPGTGTPALAVAVARLQRAVEGGGAYAVELDALEALAPQYGALADLRGHAQTGVETRASLAARFASLADAARTGTDGGDAGAQSEGGLIADLWDRVTAMVDVRRQDAGDPQAAVARLDAAAVHVGNGDLDAAARELSGPGAPADARAWADAVRARLAAERALQEIVRRSLLDMAANGGRSGS